MKKITKIISVTIEWRKKQLESSVNLISFSQNSVIPFISRHTSPCKIKIEKKLNQIAEDCVIAIAGGALPFLIAREV